jgi:hypothetical protein
MTLDRYAFCIFFRIEGEQFFGLGFFRREVEF